MRKRISATVRMGGLLVGLSCPVANAEADSTIVHLPADPLAAGVYRFELAEMVDSWIELMSPLTGENSDPITDFYSEMSEKVGMSFRDDVLDQLGPDFAFALDLPPLETLMAATQSGSDQEIFSPEFVERLVVVIGYGDRDKAVRALGALIGLAEGQVTHEESHLTIRFGTGSSADSPAPVFHGRMGGGLLVLSGSSARAEEALAGFENGAGLTSGEDFATVAAQVDTHTEMLTYLNLPKAREWLKEWGGDTGNEFLQRYLGDEWMGTGAIHTSTRAAGGIRMMRFGPPAITGFFSPFSGGDALLPFLGKLTSGIGEHAARKRTGHDGTMTDLRSIGVAIEEYAIDHNGYPSTGGWAELDGIRGEVEPVYIRQLPLTDGWDRPFKLWSSPEGYCLVSAGSDGELERDWTGEEAAGANNAEGADIVFCNGQFMQWPEAR